MDILLETLFGSLNKQRDSSGWLERNSPVLQKMMDSHIYVESAVILANLFVAKSVDKDFTWNVSLTKAYPMKIRGSVTIAKMTRFF